MKSQDTSKVASYANGGPVVGSVSGFYKTPNPAVATRFKKKSPGDMMAAKNEFTSPDNADPNADEDNLYGKDGPGKGDGCYSAPAPITKSV